MSIAEFESPPASPRRKMTLEEFMALPEEKRNACELIHGELWEDDATVTTRHPKHAIVSMNLGYLLKKWVIDHDLAGFVGGNDIRCRLGKEFDEVVGIDLVYFPGEEAVKEANERNHMETAPLLAVEIASPIDSLERLETKAKLYLDSGIPQVWLIEPTWKTIRVFQPTSEPVMYNVSQSFEPGDDLPGLKIEVADVFRGCR